MNAVKLTELFLGELNREAPLTRRVLERVPEGRNERHRLLEFDLNPPGGPSGSFQTNIQTNAALLKTMDDGVAASRAALQKTSDEHLMKPWRLLVSGKTVVEQPRHIMMRDSISHLAHHRGQMTVYLRLNDVAVPAVYRPSADDQRFS